MTEREYNEAEGVRRSELWMMRESPEKYLWAKTHPDTEPTPALQFGAMVHKLLLEPETFGEEYVVAPDVDRRTKAGKEAWNAVVENASAEGKTVMTVEDFAKATDMVEAVKRHPIANRLINGPGKHEEALFWTDEDTGIKCKVRLDALVGKGKDMMVVDYKTAADAKTDVVSRMIFRYGYHVQSHMYTHAVQVNYGLKERPPFVLVVQEKKPPYAVNVIQLTEDVILAGEDDFRLYIGMLHQCRETGFFYGYNGAFNEMNEAYLPGYVQIGNEEEE